MESFRFAGTYDAIFWAVVLVVLLIVILLRIIDRFMNPTKAYVYLKSGSVVSFNAHKMSRDPNRNIRWETKGPFSYNNLGYLGSVDKTVDAIKIVDRRRKLFP